MLGDLRKSFPVEPYQYGILRCEQEQQAQEHTKSGQKKPDQKKLTGGKGLDAEW